MKKPIWIEREDCLTRDPSAPMVFPRHLIPLAGGAVFIAAGWLVIRHQTQSDHSDRAAQETPLRASRTRTAPETRSPEISAEQAALDSLPVANLVAMFEPDSTPLEREKFLRMMRVLAAIAGSDPATALKLIEQNLNQPAIFLAFQSEPLISDRLLKERDTLLNWLATTRTALCGGADIMLLQLRKRLISEPGQFHLIDQFGMSDAQRRDTINHGLTSVACRDLKEALTLMEQYAPNAEHRATALRLLAARAGDDPERAFEHLADLGKYLSNAAYPVIFREWLKLDPQLAIERMRTISSGALASILSDPKALGNLVNHDSAATVSLLRRLTLTTHNTGVFDQTLDCLAKKDPAVAMELVANLPAGEYRKQAAGRWLSVVTARNPAATTDSIALLPEELQPDARLSAAARLAYPERQLALALAAGAPPEQQTALYREIVMETAAHDAEGAIRLLDDPAIGPKLAPDDRLKVIGKTAAGLTISNPDAACQWIARLPTEDQPAATGSALSVWMTLDPEQAMKWLTSQTPGPARDAGARVVIEQLKNTNPKEAGQWRATLQEATE